MRWAGIARMGGIGDNLIAASTLRPLKRMGYMNEVITSESSHSVFLNNPFIDKLTVKKDGEIPGGAEWQKWFVARAKEYDLFAHLSHSCEVRHACLTDSTAFWSSDAYRRKLCAGSYLETVHDIVGVPYTFGPLFFPTEEERQRANQTKETQIKGRFIAWVISGSRVDKIYPYMNIAAARIIKELGITVVAIGAGPKQFEFAKEIQERVKRQNSTDDGFHVALSPDDAPPGGDRHWSMRRSLTLAMSADLVITPDTGIAWAVAMEAMPKIMLLSHASAENITKHWVNTTTLHADPDNVPCWPCHRLHDTIDTCHKGKDTEAAACMADISVERLLEAVRAKIT